MIPPHILQIALGESYISRLPLALLKENLVNKNPSMDYTLLTDTEAILFLTNYYPEYIPLYNELFRPQYKSDLLRYLWLYAYGGYYIDIDILPTIPLTDIWNLTDHSSLFTCIGAHTDPVKGVLEVANGFLATEPKNPLFLRLCERILENPNPEDYGTNVKQLWKELSSQHSMTPYSKEKGVFLLEEKSDGGRYSIFYKTERIAYGNGSGYPFQIPSPSLPTTSPIWLSYYPRGLTDGAGSQLQRILSIYLISKYYKLNYIHQGLEECSYQGLQCLERNTEDPDQLHLYNTLFQLPSDPLPSTIYSCIVDDLQDSMFHIQQPLLIQTKFAGTLMDANPALLQQPIPLPWLRDRRQRNSLHIAVHIRRGELFVVDSSRMLPNSYYIECMRELQAIFKVANIPFTFHIYTEQVTKPVTVTPTHHGICSRISYSITLRPEDTHLEDFSEFTDAQWHINTCPVETLKALATADVLLASRSSFSYVAAILNQEGIVLFHPFWHSLSPSWIPCRRGTDIRMESLSILKKAIELRSKHTL